MVISKEDIEFYRAHSLEVVASRISPCEALLILLAVALGIGYLETSGFYMEHPIFFLYPIITAVMNTVFGLISVHMLIEVYRFTEGRLGSLQEIAYYFTGDRSIIMMIGVQYGLFCLVMAAYCLSMTVDYIILYIESITGLISATKTIASFLGSPVGWDFFFARAAILILCSLAVYPLTLR